MKAKEYLSQAYRLDQRVMAKIEQVASLRKLAAKETTTLYGTAPGSSQNEHHMEAIIRKITDLENEINTDIDNLVDLKREIVMSIKSVPNMECQMLLELRYLCLKSWEQIAVKMGYDLRYTHKLHKRALAECNIDAAA